MLAWTINVVAAPAIVTNFPIPSSSACSVAVNPSLNKIYVSGGASPGHNVIVIDGSTFAQTTVGTGSGVLSVDTVSDRYWAGTVYGGSVIVRDGVTNATVINKGLGYCPIEADVDSVHRRVWVGAQCGGDMVWAIDADTFATIAGPISTGGVLGPIRVNPVTGRLYVYPSGVSKRVNPTTFAVTTNAFGWVAGVNPVANRLYAVSGSTLQIIDGAPDPEVILASVPLPFITIAGYPIGVNTALNRIYISSHADYSLYTLDGTTGAGLGSVSLGTGVSIGDIAVDSTNGRIYMITSTPIGPQLFVLQDVPVPNSPPNADAGDNIQIPSTDQAHTTIQVTATDPEGDPLEYRWLDGAKVLLDWSPVGENGEAYLNLGTLPCLSFGNHILKLEIREAKEGGQLASDTMILTIASPASIVGWGYNNYGQATPPGGGAGAGTDFIAIAAGGSWEGGHSLALKSDGSIVGWGSNRDWCGRWCGQANPPAGNGFVKIAAGMFHSLALKSDGSIVCWGGNYYGESSPPIGNDFVAIGGGVGHSIALKSDGSIVGWGCNNDNGQATPPPGDDFIAIAAGGWHNIALKSDGSIVGWGANGVGQASPPAGNDFVAIAAGEVYSLGLKRDGSIVGWGDNYFGQCNVPSGNDFVAIAAGEHHGLALKSDGSIVGWGYNNYGQASPPAGNNFIAIAAGGNHSLALCEEISNVPPVASAGDNIQILSTEQAGTVIKGSATDQDGDTLQYRWLEGEQVLLDWSPVGETGEAYLNLGTLPYLSVGNHTLTLEVREAKEGGLAASDEMILTVQNSPPQAQPAPSHQVVEIGIDLIVVVADVADSDGDTVTYQWLKGSEVLASGSVQTVQGGASVQIPDLVIQAGDERFPVGLHQIELTVSDGINDPVSAIVSVEVKDTKAPSLIPMPSVTILWPPNHELQPVTIAANAFDNGGGAIHLDVSVQSSQPPDSGGDGHTIPDYYIDSVDDETGIIQLRLRSERAGTGDGRTYKITITATDVSGNNSIAIVEIRAPHDKRKK
jgi:hypothetical protein